jgi:DNA-binding LacI/PurR family transcriptional regulator
MSQRNGRFCSVIEALRSQIRNSFVSGEILPPYRTLAAMHGVGTDMIKRALKVLSDQGLVKVVPRVGAFKKRQSDAQSKSRAPLARDKTLRVALITKRHISELPQFRIYSALQDEARRRKLDLMLLTSTHRSRSTLDGEYIQLDRVPWNTFDIGLLVEAEQSIPRFASTLRQHKVLAVDQDATRFAISSVCFSHYEAGAMAARYLLSLDHMRFAILDECNAPGFACDPGWTVRNCGYESTVRERGGMLLPKWRITTARLGSFFSPREKYSKTTIANWAATPAENRPTALFATSFLYVPEIIQELSRHGLYVPRHMSIVIPTEDEGRSIMKDPNLELSKFTCIHFEVSILARRTFDAACELWDACEESTMPKLFLAPAILRPGESTAVPRRYPQNTTAK